MSALAGAIYFDTSRSASLSAAMDALAFYGGDGSGVWSEANVALGQQMRHLTPQSVTEQQPLVQDTRVLVADARLDYRAELCAVLGLEQDLPDSRLILEAYNKWGSGCVDHLLGDYAFAIWDTSAQTLFCARDHIGARPFFYYHTHDLFAFATDIAALLQIDGVHYAVNEQIIADTLHSNQPAIALTHDTRINNIYRLLPGMCLRVEADGTVRQTRYWDPAKITPIHLADEDAYAQTLRQTVEDAVYSRLETSGKIGAHLSGGIDSTSLAVIAHRALRQAGRDLINYSWSPLPADEAKGEYPRILRVRDAEGFVVKFVDTSALRPEQFHTVDETIYEERTLLYERVVQQQAEADGVRLILSGWGGDETISYNGQSVFRKQFWRGQWWPLLKNLQPPTMPLSRKTPQYMARNFWHHVVAPSLPVALQKRISPMKALREPTERFIHPDFKLTPRQDDEASWADAIRNPQIALYHYGHLTARMESWYWSGAERGLTYTYPLTDRRVMELALALPPSLYLQNGWQRYIYRRAMDDLLPEGFVWNRLGFMKSAPVMQQADVDFETHERLVDDMLEHYREMPWVDVPKLIAARGAARQEQPPVQDRIAMQRAITCVRIWHFAQQHQSHYPEPTH